LDAFIEDLPPKVCGAFEFRHESWLDDAVYSRLAGRNLALCVADSEKLSTPVRVTADYAYFRLRDEGYTPDDIKRWAATIGRETAKCRDTYVYFKQEEEGKAPESAKLLMQHSGITHNGVVGGASRLRLRGPPAETRCCSGRRWPTGTD